MNTNEALNNFFLELSSDNLTNEEIRTRIEDNPNPTDMQEVYEQYIAIKEGVKLYEKERIKQTLLANSYVDTKIRRIRKYIIYTVSAASIAAFFIFSYSNMLFNHDVYNTFHLYEKVGNEMGDFLDKKSKSENNQLFLEAVTLMNEGEMEQAIDKFNSINSSELWIKTRYNLALCYIKIRQYKDAKKELYLIANNSKEHYLATPSREMIKILEQPKIVFLVRNLGVNKSS